MLKNISIGLTIASVLVLGLGLVSSSSNHPTTDRDIAATTAKITNHAGNSGGTGVVLRSGPHSSIVLTNAHVCGVVKFGGLVSTDSKTGTVTSYKVSEVHDLCLITTNIDFGVNTDVATESPSDYSDAIVSGHPSLLPTVITKGHFGGKEVFDIMTGVRECTKEDYESDLAILCAFLGGIPVIKTYQAQVASPTIMPGSSGSAVFNKKGLISGLVFAGQGNLGYAHIVPVEYINNFLQNELPTLKAKTPLDNSENKLRQQIGNKLKEACENKNDVIGYEIVKDYCKYVGRDFIYE